MNYHSDGTLTNSHIRIICWKYYPKSCLTSMHVMLLNHICFSYLIVAVWLVYAFTPSIVIATLTFMLLSVASRYLLGYVLQGRTQVCDVPPYYKRTSTMNQRSHTYSVHSLVFNCFCVCFFSFFFNSLFFFIDIPSPIVLGS